MGLPKRAKTPLDEKRELQICSECQLRVDLNVSGIGWRRFLKLLFWFWLCGSVCLSAIHYLFSYSTYSAIKSTLFHNNEEDADPPPRQFNDSTEPSVSRALLATETLQKYYTPATGLYDTTGWWNSANALTALADLTLLHPPFLEIAIPVFENTFEKAQQQTALADVTKTMSPHHLGSSPPQASRRAKEAEGGNNGFKNAYYDDEAWWALLWLRVHALSPHPRYLSTAVSLFDDMALGWSGPCGGGLWWDKSHTYLGAIENELFLSVASNLALAHPPSSSERGFYLFWARRIYQWFVKSGMIDPHHSTINNGLNLTTCTNDNGTVWTYNQGVVLGGLASLAQLTDDENERAEYLDLANRIATAAITDPGLVDPTTGVLHEPCEAQGQNCGADGPQFKGIFVRNLGYLVQQIGSRGLGPMWLYKDFILRNAESLWLHDRDEVHNAIGLRWTGPFEEGSASAATQGSGLDALVAGVLVESL
ncbi:MAG: hypothetical protein LQ342_003151 [Letrouitia transgressa]|nr:MAG: hypothetical protein LQ342_003151 [Letrouitia transgressa]